MHQRAQKRRGRRLSALADTRRRSSALIGARRRSSALVGGRRAKVAQPDASSGAANSSQFAMAIGCCCSDS